MSGDELKKLVPKWGAKIGFHEARMQLQLAGLGFSTSEKLLKGEYVSTPTGKSVDIIRRALGDFAKAKAS